MSLDESLFSYMSENQSEERAYENAYNIQHVLSQNEFQLLPALLLNIIQGKVTAIIDTYFHTLMLIHIYTYANFTVNQLSKSLIILRS